MTDNTKKWLSRYLFLTMAVSSFVTIEPALYDLLFISFIAMGFLLSIISFTKETTFPLIVICLFLCSNFLSLFFVNEFKPSIIYTGITLYLIMTWICLVGMGSFLNGIYLRFILLGYLLSACLSAAIGVSAYYYLLPSSDNFLLFGRATSFFKDPNVFGPFLVIPAIFAIYMIEIQKNSIVKKIIYFIIFMIVTAGIIVSFSRAAWGNFAITLVIYLFVVKKGFVKKRLKTIVILLLIVIPVILVFVQSPLVEDMLMSRLGYQGYDDGRFNTQKNAFLTALSNPLGIGPGQSDIYFNRSPHSLYARIFTENGIVGLISFLILIISSLFKSFQSYWQSNDEQNILYLVVFASLIGLAFNSFFIDTLHWRHLWFLLAISWIPNISQGEKGKVNTDY